MTTPSTSLLQELRRELRVAFSRKAQPLWFRISKWTVAFIVFVMTYDLPYFWAYLLGGLIGGVLLHLFWRWKTCAWTRPWGGWNDLEAGRRTPE